MISPEKIRQVRAHVTAGIADVKAALEATGGDIDAAIERIRLAAAPPSAAPSSAPRKRPTTMDRQSHAVIDALAPALALVIERGVPSTCFPVRVADDWNLLGAGQYHRRLMADFSGEEGGESLHDLLRVTVSGLGSALAPAPSDPAEPGRFLFAVGKRHLRVGPATALLLDSALDVMRLELLGPSTLREVVQVTGDSQHFLDEFAPIEVTRVTRETFIAVGSDLPGGGRLSATFTAPADLDLRLRSVSYRYDPVARRYRRHDPATGEVHVHGEQATWEATW